MVANCVVGSVALEIMYHLKVCSVQSLKCSSDCLPCFTAANWCSWFKPGTAASQVCFLGNMCLEKHNIVLFCFYSYLDPITSFSDRYKMAWERGWCIMKPARAQITVLFEFSSVLVGSTHMTSPVFRKQRENAPACSHLILHPSQKID